MCRYLSSFMMLLLLAVPVQADFDESAYARFTLDEMIDNFKATNKGQVEITMFKPIAFEAAVVSLPEPKKTDYVQRLIRDFNTSDDSAAVTHGMRVRSLEGRAYSVYVMDELVPQAQELLQSGDKATFYVYHAFNAANGPGLILHSFLRHPKPSQWQQLTDWVDALFTNTN